MVAAGDLQRHGAVDSASGPIGCDYKWTIGKSWAWQSCRGEKPSLRIENTLIEFEKVVVGKGTPSHSPQNRCIFGVRFLAHVLDQEHDEIQFSIR